jgi:hypothetical protein
MTRRARSCSDSAASVIAGVLFAGALLAAPASAPSVQPVPHAPDHVGVVPIPTLLDVTPIPSAALVRAEAKCRKAKAVQRCVERALLHYTPKEQAK